MRVLALGAAPHSVLAVTRSLARHGAAVVLGMSETASCPAAMIRHCREVARVPAPEGRAGSFPGRLARAQPVEVVLPLGDRWLQPLALQAEA